MANDLMSYEQYMAEHEAKEKYKEEHPEVYPWIGYFDYGSRVSIAYLSNDEVMNAVDFYRLIEGHTDDGKIEYYRLGRQPISIINR